MKIKLKKLKMYEVQSSYIVFYLLMAWGEVNRGWGVRGWRFECWEDGVDEASEVDQHHSSVNEQLIGIFLPN